MSRTNSLAPSCQMFGCILHMQKIRASHHFGIVGPIPRCYQHIFFDFCMAAINKNCKSYCKGYARFLSLHLESDSLLGLMQNTDEFANADD